ncbi:MAG: NIPSNAP family protein [Acidobacteria bacterium]|nr:NIPSNAP family protein [Acidobacteriota bacterium]
MPTTAAAQERLFEIRTYTTLDGRLDALHARFRDNTNRIFVKHGMSLIGYWTPTEGPESSNTLVYILAFPNKEAREKAWAAFRVDPEWKKVQAESEKDGKIVKEVKSQFLRATNYSPIQ